MSSLLGGAPKTRVNKPTPASSVRIQSSVNGQPRPIIYGQVRIAGNIIWYGDFIAIAHQSSPPSAGKGGGGGGGGKGASGSTTYTYRAAVLYGLCEGPVDAILEAWNNKTPDYLADLNFTAIDGAPSQAPWTYLTSNHPGQALGYTDLAMAGAGPLDLGNNAELPNLNWEVRAAISGAVTETYTVGAPYTVTPTYFSLASSTIEMGTVPPGSPYHLQAQNYLAPAALPVILRNIKGASIPGSASAGVTYTNTGVPLTQVSSGPTAGQYSVTAGGLYTFAAADAGQAVTIVDLAVSPGVNYVYQPTGNTHGTTAVDNLSSMTGIVAGALATGSGVQPGTVVQSVDLVHSSVTLSQPTTSSLTGATLTFYGAALIQVLGTPGHGEYSVSVQAGSYGQYQFAAADVGSVVLITDVPDADPSLALTDFLTNPRYGCGFPAANLGSLTQLQDYAYALGLFVSPALITQSAANTWLKDFATGLNGEFVWSSGLLTFVPYGDASATGNGKTYTPPAWPIYSLGDDDYLKNEGTAAAGVSAFTSDDPVVAVIQDQANFHNDVKVEYLDRGNSYNPDITEAQDDAAVNTFGLRAKDTKQLHFFCSVAAAQASVQLQLGREQPRNIYSFTVPWYFILLDPMDVIEITDTALGVNAKPVRITEITENQADWSLTITAEEYLAGSAQTPLYGTQPKSGFTPNYNVDPGLAVAPVVFEPPAQLASNGGLEIWLAAGGGVNYGGADVYVSRDGNAYRLAGRMVGPSRVGVTTGDFPLGSDPDTTDTLAIDLTSTSGQVLSGTQADADQAATLCYVGGYPLPPAPALAEVAGGSLASRTVYARATYVFASGEGPASAEDSFAADANNLTTAPSPAAQTGATGWNLYAATSSGAETKQNSSPIALGTAWTEPGTGLTTTGAAPPGATAGYELVAYETATLTSSYKYSLGTYIRRGMYGSTISDHPAGAQFARLDQSVFAVPYDKSQIGQTILIKLAPFNIYGGGVYDISEVQPFQHVIEGPPLPGTVQNFVVGQTGGSVVMSWTDLTDFGSLKGYDILYGEHGDPLGVANAQFLTEAARTTEMTNAAVPPGTWTFYIRGHDIADRLGPVSSFDLTVTNENTLVVDEQDASAWHGTLSGFVRQWNGILIPDSTTLANGHTNAQLFEQFVPFPVATSSYESAANDTGFNDTLRVYSNIAAPLGRGQGGISTPMFAIDTWLTGQTDPGTWTGWTVGTVEMRYLRGRGTLANVAGAVSYLSGFEILADRAPKVENSAAAVTIAAGGTLITFPTPYHAIPSVLLTPVAGSSLAATAQNITTTGFTAHIFNPATGADVGGSANWYSTGT